MEKKSTKAVLGGLLSTVSLMAGVIWTPVQASSEEIVPVEQAFVPETVIETRRTGSVIVPEMTGISQGYYLWHPGVDITAPAGSEILPIKAGIVIKVENAKGGYGRNVIIDHGDGLESLYAHLGKIMVEEGDEVEGDTVIAEIGLTGRTTGYHLHLEVRIDGRTVSPFAYLRGDN